jgi:two-component system NtrC family response regulator
MEVIVRELLIGESEAIQRLRAMIVRVAPTAVPVLIEGPTGSGKELVAQALHEASGRRGQFVPFNVCAIADTMFEDALFGHVRGAFTGALGDAAGFLRQAHEGTAFFDEVSGLPLASQAKLLRAIETGEFRPVGASKDVKSQFRIVAATNQRLGPLSERGAFREDLLHRFGKLIVRIPALRDRREDIPRLAACFLGRCSPKGAHRLLPAALDRLAEYDWPGNVRELRAVIETAVALAVDERIGADDIDRIQADTGPRRATPLLDFQVRRTIETLHEVKGDADLAAATLGVHRSTIYRRIQRAQAEGIYP